MKIAGLQKFTASDFPGRIAAIVFTAGCNLRCPWCHNPSLVIPPENACYGTEDAVLMYLQDVQGFLTGVVISGGEPTIQPELVNFLRKIKAMGFAIKLDTNGSKPDVMKTLMDENLLDAVGLDFKLPPEKFSSIEKDKTPWYSQWETTLNLCSQAASEKKLKLEVRTTIHSKFFTKESSLRMAQILSVAGVNEWVWQSYKEPPEGVLAKDLPNGYINKKELALWAEELEKLLDASGYAPVKILWRY